MTPPAIVWFTRDLRLDDHRPLAAAAGQGPVVCVYILDDDAAGCWRAGGAARWWLHFSLAALDGSLRKRGNRLLLLRGDSVDVLTRLAQATGASAIHAHRMHEPWTVRRQERLEREGLLTLHDGCTLVNHAQVRTAGGTPYRVFTPFWRAVQEQMPPAWPLAVPEDLPAPALLPDGDRLADWRLCPAHPDWAAGWETLWQPGEAGALRALDAFLEEAAQSYARDRDFPALAGTSRLSAHLHLGEISPARVWHQAQDCLGAVALPWLRQLAWRDFSVHLLHQSPDLGERNWQSAFDAFPWVEDAEGLRAWQSGRTGYPVVDAGMRELWATGWMHNRVRMIVASFLIKDLMIHWRQGEDWFWDTLVDADLANNAAGWQWVAGSGADAAPFFRIFNPVSQGRKFDPDGAYIRRWVPELARLDSRFIHAPWEAAPLELAGAGVRLGVTYPEPIVDHARARDRALAGWHSLKAGAQAAN